MNFIRKSLLNILGRLLAKWDKTWLANHLQGNRNTIRSQRYAHRLGNDTLVVKGNITIKGESCIHVGNYTRFDNDCVITSYEKTPDGSNFSPEIIIGEKCSFGAWNHITAINKIIVGDGFLSGKWVTISDNNHGNNSREQLCIEPICRPNTSKGSIIIGKNVWVGDKVTILSGVNIGDGVVVAANSVVTKDIPSYSVVAGNPAKILKEIK